MPKFQSGVNAAGAAGTCADGTPLPSPQTGGYCAVNHRPNFSPPLQPSLRRGFRSLAISQPAHKNAMKLKNIFVATSLAFAASASMADAVVSMIDLSNGDGRFGRNNAVGSFTDTYTFTLPFTALLVSSTTGGAASGNPHLEFTSLQITDALSNVLATFAGSLGDDQHKFYSLRPTWFAAGNYRLLIRGVNSPVQASYSGNLAISAAPNAVPEPGMLALLLAGLSGAALWSRRGAASQASAKRSQ